MVTPPDQLPELSEVGFEDLFDLEVIQRLQGQFAQATGVASIITRIDGTPITRPSNFCRLCDSIIRNTDKGRANCYRSDAIIGRASTKGPTLQRCLSGGLWDAGAGITVAGRHIANWLIGQVRDESQSEAVVRQYAREIGANEEATAEAFREVPSMSRDRFALVAQTLFTLANLLSELAFRNFEQRHMIRNLDRAEQALRVSAQELEFQNLILKTQQESMLDGMLIVGPRGEVLSHNRRFATLWQIPDELLAPMDDAALVDFVVSQLADPESFQKRVRYLYDHPTESSFEEIALTDGRVFERYSTSIMTGEGIYRGRVWYFHDITDKRAAERAREQLQEQWLQAQKMESVGCLASGIAHDFNNMLGAIIGTADLLALSIDEAPERSELVTLIRDAALRAADLTSRLLAFSRKSPRRADPVDVHEILRQTVILLKRSIDKRIDIKCHLDALQSIVSGDESLLSSAFLNVGINARDAMPEGGALTFSTRTLELDDASARTAPALDLPTGTYVEVAVSDTGIGMTEETRKRIFDPFFTTKGVGKGTGLGLAAVYGTVTSHGGSIHVRSELGVGSIFKIYLPISNESSVQRPQGSTARHCGRGLALVVDDEDLVRAMAKNMLESMGYDVVLGADGYEGVEIFEKEHQRLRFVLLDLVMPKLDGIAVLAQLRRIDANVPVVIASGFVPEDFAAAAMTGGAKALINKPYGLDDLSAVLTKLEVDGSLTPSGIESDLA